MGHRVTVANPRRVKLISESQNKTDRHDAELLARLGRADEGLLAPVKHRSQQAQADLAVASHNIHTVNTYVGNGDGTFGTPVSHAVANNPISVTTGDLNGDGFDEVVAVPDFGNVAQVLRAVGDGTFEPAASYGIGGNTSNREVRLLDVDADGLLDIVVGQHYNSTVDEGEKVAVRAYLNEGVDGDLGYYSVLFVRSDSPYKTLEDMIAAHVAVGEERVVLEHEADAALVGAQPREIAAVQGEAPRLGRLQPGHGPQQRGLAAAGGAEDADEFARLDPDGRLLDRLVRQASLAKHDRYIIDFDEAGLDELELEIGDLRVRLARPRTPVVTADVRDEQHGKREQHHQGARGDVGRALASLLAPSAVAVAAGHTDSPNQ